MVNRLIFADGSDGTELIRRMQADGYADTPVMLISNYAESQEKAVGQGAVPGFGKAAVGAPETLELLGQYLRT
jgi:CheY-like chemotaxis protein